MGSGSGNDVAEEEPLEDPGTKLKVLSKDGQCLC